MSTPSFQENRPGLERALNSSFSPYMPINQARFFKGRTGQIREVVDTIRAPGLHATIYGERGVGKTSLANIIQEFLEEVITVGRVNCTEDDTFDSALRRCLEGLPVARERARIGFGGPSENEVMAAVDLLPPRRRASPDGVATILARFPAFYLLVFDEFDRLPRRQSSAFANLVKALSDRGGYTTIVLVGVGETVNALIESHASVERCLRQIPLPRMSDTELGEIVDVGLSSAGFTLTSTAPRERILWVSQGFPHYTHLLAQNAGRSALDRETTIIDEDDVLRGMVLAVERAHQSHREMYYRATTATKRRSLWTEVVAACALAPSDDRGYFSSRAVVDTLSRLLRRTVIQQTVAFHLGKLTEASRGPLIERVGPERRYRYRFTNPLMRPFIIMKAVGDKLIGT